MVIIMAGANSMKYGRPLNETQCKACGANLYFYSESMVKCYKCSADVKNITSLTTNVDSCVDYYRKKC